MSESQQEKVQRVRRPRVHPKIKVETEGAEVETELPFVIGVLGDYSGNEPQHKKEPMDQRGFVEINRGNFDEVMSKMGPGLRISVPNTLKEDGKNLSVALKFNSIEDFEPARVVAQVEPLAKLLEARNRLRDLMNKVDRSQPLEGELEKILNNKDDLERLQAELGIKPKASPSPEASETLPKEG